MELDLPSDHTSTFRNSLLIPMEQRSVVDVDLIYRHLREMQATTLLSEQAVMAMAQSARYEIHESNELLYTATDIAQCWYILLSGSVYLDGCMFLPGSSFGKNSVGGKRGCDCLILEKSEMVVIDYPNEKMFKPYQRKSYSTHDLEKLLALESDEIKVGVQVEVQEEQLPKELLNVQEIVRRSEAYLDRVGKEEQRKSSGSGTRRAYSNDELDLDLSGLKETMVHSPFMHSYKANWALVDALDSDDEDDVTLAGSESSAVRDIVRDCLEKEPSERTENDINILMDFMQHLPAFSKLSHNVRREMCKVMVFAVVEQAGSLVLKDKEEMDSWCVILNGSVEIYEDGKPPVTMHLGDWFGVKTTPETIFHKGEMRTRVDDCQFVCIAQEDYWRIFSQGEASTRKVEEEGEVVMVTEHRVTDGGSRQGQVVIRATSERLLDHLMDDHSSIDPTYVEDFLLTYCVFNDKPHELASKLLQWFDRGQLKDKVTRVMLLWVNNHYGDFEGDHYMESMLERFEYLLEAKHMDGQLRLLNMACSAKSKPRIVTLDVQGLIVGCWERTSRESRLEFSITGGKDRGFSIFIYKVDFDSKAYDSGLKRGDQILEVNGQSFEGITGPKAIEVLMAHTHLRITVKRNVIGFKEVSASQQKSPRKKEDSRKGTSPSKKPPIHRSTSDSSDRPKPSVRKNGHDTSPSVPQRLHTEKIHDGNATLPRSKKNFKRAMMKLNIIPRTVSNNEINKNDNDQANINRSYPRPLEQTRTSSSTDNIENTTSQSEMTWDLNCFVIKVYKADHTSKYFVIGRETRAKDVVDMAIDQFGITDHTKHKYFLSEVTVSKDGLIKQKRLPEAAADLSNRSSLNGRYYIRGTVSDGIITDEVAQEIARESHFSVLQLSPLEMAKELTLQDFDLFKSIDSREYIYNLFESKKEERFQNMKAFEKTTNIEMFWVVREVCNEPNLIKRMKMIKYFVKVAKFCKEFKNYNSLFAIVSGLGHSAVSRLKQTWDKLPTKHIKIFEDLQALMDPSRNMSKYRNLFSGERAYPPVIPFIPIVKKDLTFLHLGNDTYVDGLVNFEKLRMIAKEVRKVCKYCAIGYDPNKMDHLSLTNNSAAPNIAQSVVSIMTGQSTTSRRSGRRASSYRSPKLMYEEALLARRIKHLLEGLATEDCDENKLRAISLTLEPPAGSSLANTQARRKPSPLPSPSPQKKKSEARDRPELSPSVTRQSGDSVSLGSSTGTGTPTSSLPPSPKGSNPDVRETNDNSRIDPSLHQPRKRGSPRKGDDLSRSAFSDSVSSGSTSSSESFKNATLVSTRSLETGSVKSTASIEAGGSVFYPHYVEEIDFDDTEGQVSVV